MNANIGRLRNSVNWGSKAKGLNGLLVLALLLLLTMPLMSVPAIAYVNIEPPRADPELLRLAAEHPDDVFAIIVQRDAARKDLPDETPEQAVKNAGGQVKQQLNLITSFSAQLPGKEIIKLAKLKKVRWISFDAPLFTSALPGFGTTGILTTAFSANSDGANAVALQPDGKLVVVGYAYDGSKYVFAVARYNANGTLDAAFDGDGKVTTAVGSLSDSASAVAIQPDGKIVVVGTSNVGSYQDFAAVRYNPDGSLDTTFSGDGKQTTSISTKIENARAVAIQPDGKIVLAGYANLGANNDDIALLRYNTNGTLDTTFDGNGKVTTTISTSWEYGQAVAIQADGKIVVAGQTKGSTTKGDIVVVRYNTNGSPDATFDDDGQVSTDFNSDTDQAYAVKVQPDGKIVVAGTTQMSDGTPDVALVRYNANGSLDSTFGASGKVTTPIGSSYDYASALALQPDGKLVVAGQSKNASNFDVALLRYNTNGSLDTTFDTDGKATTAIGSADDAGYAVALQSDGKIVVVGDSNLSGNTDFAVVRFNGDGGLDCTQCLDTGSLANVYNRAIGADRLWNGAAHLQGQGITAAIVDSGVADHPDLQVMGGGISRILLSTTPLTNAIASNDGYGHGTLVAGIIGGNGNASNGGRLGVAPAVNLINVKVANDQGMSLASDLVSGLEWIYNNRAAYNIKVVNISLNSSLQEAYNVSALDAAVEKLWFNGIVVVVSAGNNGTGSPVTLYPPANDPFVITVGAADDMGTASLSDDALAAFSAYGTTEDNFTKPDLVAPGRNIIGPLAGTGAAIYTDHSANRVDNSVFRLSGTSMSAPVVAGAVALLLQSEPNLNPDQVKYRLMATANKTWPGYNAAKAGAGYLDVYAAVYGTTTQSANIGLAASQLLSSGSAPITWGSVQWNSVQWNSVQWNSVQRNSVQWNSDYWGP